MAGAPGDDARGLPGRGGRDVPAERRGHRGYEGSSGERGADGDARREAGTTPVEQRTPLSREDIERTPALARRYAQEYRVALRLVRDRDLASHVARLNLWAQQRGERPFVTREVVTRLGVDGLRQVIARDGWDLALLRSALATTRILSQSLDRGMGPER